jgi:hypothetical protein
MFRDLTLITCYFASFFWMLFISIIKIPLMLRMNNLSHILFFNPTSEYLEYIIKKEILVQYSRERVQVLVSEHDALILGIISSSSMLRIVPSRLCLLKQTTMIQTCSPVMPTRIPIRDMW